ncbi:MAG: hypothetical protein ABSE49_20370 [Polyangiaceae bacterium]|jgi:hypothetical protein
MRPGSGILAFALLSASRCDAGSPSGATASPSASAAPATADSAPCVATIAEHQRSVTAHLEAARTKTSARDGAGCLAELDAYDREAWDSSPSTSASSAMATSRALCMMLAGDCTRGKELYRAAMATSSGAMMGPETLDRSVDTMGSLYCQGGTLEPRDALLRASMDLNQGAYMSTTTTAACLTAIDTMKRLLPVVAPKGPDDSQITQAPAILRMAGPECLARAGDCDAAWRVFHDEWLAVKPFDDPTLKKMFANSVKHCGDGG